VRFGNGISTIPERVIGEIRKLEAARQLVIEVERVNPYVVGRKVKVHLPVADIHGVIIRMMNDVKVVVDTTMGRATVPVSALILD